MVNSNDNPYAPPEAVGSGAFAEKNSLRWTVARFRAECRALAGAAMFVSLMAALISYLLRPRPRMPTSDFVSQMFVGFSAAAVVVCIGILSKKMWAVRVFLFFNWLMALLTVLAVFGVGDFSPGPMLFVIFFAAIFALAATQCHRVLRWSQQIRGAGYPLTVRSDDVSESSF